MPMKAEPSSMLSKAQIVHTVDKLWLVEPAFAAGALALLDKIPASDMQFAAVPSTVDKNIRSGNGYEVIPDSGTALISVDGPMLNKPSSADMLFDGVESMIMLRRQIRLANADDSIKRIVLDIDCPGSQSEGICDLALEVMSSEKPIYALVQYKAFSGGYWLASACDKVIATDFAMLGCIGVYSTVVDLEGYWANLGVAWNLISSGDIKGHGAQGVNVSKDLLDEIQHFVDLKTDQFIEAVAHGRGLQVDDVRPMATGRIFTADQSLELGLVDAVMSESQFWSEVSFMDDDDYWNSAPTPNKEPGATRGSNAKEQRMEGTFWGSLVDKFTRKPQQAPVAEQDDAPVEVPSNVAAAATRIAANYVRSVVEAATSSLSIPPSSGEKLATLMMATMTADHNGTIALDANGDVAPGSLTSAVAEFVASLPEGGLLSAVSVEKPELPGTPISSGAAAASPVTEMLRNGTAAMKGGNK